MPTAERLARPARPHCCHKAARVPGQPATITASTPEMSMPSSRAFVVASANRSPDRNFASSSRRSSDRYPPRYAAIRLASSGSMAATCSCAVAAMASAPLRLRTNARVWTPSTTRSANRSAVVAVAVRSSATVLGCQNTNVRSLAGDVSVVTALT